MSESSRCRAKDPVHCRVHGGAFKSYLDAGSGVFLPNPANDIFATHQASERYAAVLTGRERAAITAYCDQEFSMLSLSLYDAAEYAAASGNRGPHPDLAHLDSALAKHVGGEKKTLYRATKLYGKKFNFPAEAAACMMATYPVGSRFTVPGFMSTTTNPDALFDFLTETYDDREPRKTMFSGGTREDYAGRHGGDAGLSNIVYEIETPNGVPVSSLGAMYAVKEQEHLLARGKTFEVVDVRPVTKLYKPQPHPVLGMRHATVIRLREVA